MAGFSTISSKLKEMYQTITLGGNAELELVDSLDPFSEGIIFSVMPPKKSWKNISNLSGGEKTLSSLALVFALHAFKPTPLYVMDEIDAALDFRNVSIVANIIKERTKNAQFVIISLRNNMFELSSRLVGIYKTNNCTKSICIDNGDIKKISAATTALNNSDAKTPTAGHGRFTTPNAAASNPFFANLAAGPSGSSSKTPRPTAAFASMTAMSGAQRAGPSSRSTLGAVPQLNRAVSTSSLASAASTVEGVGASASLQQMDASARPGSVRKRSGSSSSRLLGLPHTPLKLSSRVPSTPFTSRLASAREEG